MLVPKALAAWWAMSSQDTCFPGYFWDLGFPTPLSPALCYLRLGAPSSYPTGPSSASHELLLGGTWVVRQFLPIMVKLGDFIPNPCPPPPSWDFSGSPCSPGIGGVSSCSGSRV